MDGSIHILVGTHAVLEDPWNLHVWALPSSTSNTASASPSVLVYGAKAMCHPTYW